MHGLIDYCVTSIAYIVQPNTKKALQLTEMGVNMLQDWCSCTLHRVFQNAYFGVTQQIKGVGNTVFANVKHYIVTASA